MAKILNVATTDTLRGYEWKSSWWALWKTKRQPAGWISGFREHSGDCNKNTLRDNVIGSWSKTDRLCQTIKNSVSVDWQSDWFSPLLPSKMEVFCCNLNLVSRIFTQTCAYKHMHRGTHLQTPICTFSELTETQASIHAHAYTAYIQYMCEPVQTRGRPVFSSLLMIGLYSCSRNALIFPKWHPTKHQWNLSELQWNYPLMSGVFPNSTWHKLCRGMLHWHATMWRAQSHQLLWCYLASTFCDCLHSHRDSCRKLPRILCRKAKTYLIFLLFPNNTLNIEQAISIAIYLFCSIQAIVPPLACSSSWQTARKVNDKTYPAGLDIIKMWKRKKIITLYWVKVRYLI